VRYTEEYCKYNGAHALAYIGGEDEYANVNAKLKHAIQEIQATYKRVCKMPFVPPVVRYVPSEGTFYNFD